MGRSRTDIPQKDRTLLGEHAGESWIPQNPRELLLPYLEKEPVVDYTDLEARRAKAKQVYEDYGKLAEKCKRLEDEIEERCKDVVITLVPAKHHQVMNAIRRVFGVSDASKVTFQMYKRAVQEFAKLGNLNIPEPTGS